MVRSTLMNDYSLFSTVLIVLCRIYYLVLLLLPAEKKWILKVGSEIFNSDEKKIIFGSVVIIIYFRPFNWNFVHIYKRYCSKWAVCHFYVKLFCGGNFFEPVRLHNANPSTKLHQKLALLFFFSFLSKSTRIYLRFQFYRTKTLRQWNINMLILMRLNPPTNFF